MNASLCLIYSIKRGLVKFLRYQPRRSGEPANMRSLTPIFKHRFYLLLNSWWAIPCVFLMRVLKPIVFIRLGRILSNRIGEFIAETSNLLANRKTQNFKSYDFMLYLDISNQQWASMVKRSENVVRHWVKI